MPRKKKEEEFVDFKQAIVDFSEAKNFAEDYVEDCLKAAIVKAYAKVFLGIQDATGGIFKVDLANGGQTKITYGRVVTDPNDISDDFLQIDSDDEDVVAAGLKVGDTYYVSKTFEELKESTEYSKFNKSWSTTFMTSITNAEKKALMDIYKGKIGDIITGIVDRYSKEKQTWYVLIGKTIAKLETRDLIGEETFRIGEEIKMYLQAVEADSKNGANLKVSRSCPEFLRRIFETEVHEVYDGTVIIEKIARIAGKRSKVAVYTNDPNVDPCGACIGMNGGRIQAITQNLGNAKEKEKIDVVLYEKNPLLFIAEALVPAHVTGIDMAADGKSCTAIVKNGELSLAIGKAGINVKLAGKLCNIKIDIIEQDEAYKRGLLFKSVDDIRKQVEEERTQERLEKLAKEKEKQAEEELHKTEEAQVVSLKEATINAPVSENQTTSEPVAQEQPVVSETVSVPTAKPVEVVAPAPSSSSESKVEVKVTTSITELEKQIEEEKKHTATKQIQKKNYKKFKKDENKQSSKPSDKDKENQQGMAIYTEEELAELEKEETEETYGVDDDNKNYEEYDDDTLYSGDK